MKGIEHTGDCWQFHFTRVALTHSRMLVLFPTFQNVPSGGFRTSRGGRGPIPKGGGALTYYLTNFSRKLHENDIASLHPPGSNTDSRNPHLLKLQSCVIQCCKRPTICKEVYRKLEVFNLTLRLTLKMRHPGTFACLTLISAQELVLSPDLVFWRCIYMHKNLWLKWCSLNRQTDRCGDKKHHRTLFSVTI